MKDALIHIYDGVPTLFVRFSIINADKHHMGNACSHKKK